MEKICNKCKKKLDINNFHKNKSKKDGFSYCCKDCQKIYSKQYYNKLSISEKNDRFLNDLRRRLKKSGFKEGEIDLDKLSSLKWDFIDYPDYQLSESLSHADFIKKYNLNINEYCFIRKKVFNNKIRINKKD